MKPLIATLLISLSGLGTESAVVVPGNAVDNVGNYRPVVNEHDVQVETGSPTTAEWCICSLSIEEKIFLQQYDFE
jgi:hypothetical protein